METLLHSYRINQQGALSQKHPTEREKRAKFLSCLFFKAQNKLQAYFNYVNTFCIFVLKSRFNQCFLILSILFSIMLCAVPHAHAQYNIGYRSLSTWNQKDNMRLDVSIWYPTYRAPSEFNLGDYIIFGARNAPILQIIDEERAVPVRILREQISQKAEEDGLTAWERLQELKKAPLPFHPLPLIVLSHDTGSTRYSNHTIAQTLAMQGYIVAIPMHEGDNAWQMSLANSARALPKRARQISACLDLLLINDALSPYIDRNNMTYLGFGSAGTAGLLLANVALRSDLWETYCDTSFDLPHTLPTLSPLDRLLEPQVHVETTHDGKRIDPYCLSPIRQNINELVEDLKIYSQYDTMTNIYYDNISQSRKNIAKEHSTDIRLYTALLKRQNPAFKNFIDTPPFIQPYFPSFEKTVSFQDARFARMIFVSPGYFLLFDQEDLLQIEKPILFVGLENDKVNLPEYQSQLFTQAVNNTQLNLSKIQRLPDNQSLEFMAHIKPDDTNNSLQNNAHTLQNRTQQSKNDILDDTDETNEYDASANYMENVNNISNQETPIEIKNNASHALLFETDIWGLQAPCPKSNELVEICNTVSEETRIEVNKRLAELIQNFVPQKKE